MNTAKRTLVTTLTKDEFEDSETAGPCPANAQYTRPIFYRVFPLF